MRNAMIRKRGASGFSLIELLLVLTIIGIISAIAIPSFMGQRRRARVIGDAQANAQVLRMQLESYRADNGVYGTAGASYVWTAAGAMPTDAAALALNFTPSGNSKMDYTVAINANQLAYTLTVTDPALANAQVYQTDQTGAVLYVMH
jgi:prepilin-type N-terminal cleavage/methylation domain-containing protein